MLRLIAVSGCSAPSVFSRNRQRALVERPRPRKVTEGMKQDSEVVEARRRIGMLGAERLLADRQCALTQRPRAPIVGLSLKHDGDVGKAPRRTRMLRAERLLVDRQRALKELLRPRVVAVIPK